MARKIEPMRRQPMSDSELEVLKELWLTGPSTVRRLVTRLHRRGNNWAYTTVQTLLVRLQRKGYVRSDTADSAHVFHPELSRDKLLALRLDDMAAELCDGAVYPLVRALLEGRDVPISELAEIRGLVDRMAGGAPDAGVELVEDGREKG